MARPLIAVIGIPGVVTVAAGITAAVIFTGHGTASTGVKGEKFVASGQTSTGGAASGAGASPTAPGKPTPPAKPTPPPPPSKQFAISGSISALAPGVASPLSLRLQNLNNQAIRVQHLTVTASGGTSQCPNAMLLLGPNFTPTSGQMSLDLLLQANASTTTATDPQFPVKLSPDAPDACQTFQWTLTYSGSAVQA